LREASLVFVLVLVLVLRLRRITGDEDKRELPTAAAAKEPSAGTRHAHPEIDAPGRSS
jgi:hypothetical protein